MFEKPLLIVDAMNAFLRAYSAFPSMSSHGHQIGGTVGFLKTLQKLIREISPENVYIVWEGGGSQKRRNIFSEYKLNRKAEKLNRFYEDDIPDSDENKKHQLITLVNIMKSLPFCQVYVSDCEGDDVVAYLCRVMFRDREKVVVSSDKDMYQLLDDKTMIYNLHKKRIIEKESVREEFAISSHNFALAKSVVGDPSDNIPGVKGIGFKTLSKNIPLLMSDEDLILEDFLKFCQGHRHDIKICQKIVDNEDTVKRNWKLVYLDGGMLSGHQVSTVTNQINTFKPEMNRVLFTKKLIKEGVYDFDIAMFMMIIGSLNFSNKEE